MSIESTIDSVVDKLTAIYTFIRTHPEYIIIILSIIVLYAVINHVMFKMKGYQPGEKTMCILSVFGKERSLEYLRDFTHMPQGQIEVIKYLRKNEPVSLNTLIKRFGRENVGPLITEEYITLT
ncbi:MAG: hypothetical protein PVF58_15875 [Candidatus Methanofastidiosia archaeon]|jgi:hypothetical protein